MLAEHPRASQVALGESAERMNLVGLPGRVAAEFPAMRAATCGAASMLARASRKRARVLRARTSSTVRAASWRAAQTTSAAR